jgi:hypothetical protein
MTDEELAKVRADVQATVDRLGRYPVAPGTWEYVEESRRQAASIARYQDPVERATMTEEELLTARLDKIDDRLQWLHCHANGIYYAHQRLRRVLIGIGYAVLSVPAMLAVVVGKLWVEGAVDGPALLSGLSGWVAAILRGYLELFLTVMAFATVYSLVYFVLSAGWKWIRAQARANP